jgi:hypothetical protein
LNNEREVNQCNTNAVMGMSIPMQMSVLRGWSTNRLPKLFGVVAQGQYVGVPGNVKRNRILQSKKERNPAAKIA